MDDALGMTGVERTTNLLHDAHSLCRRKFLCFRQNALQIFTIDVLHRDEFHAVGIAQVINTYHVLVRDLPGDNQFLLESLENLRTPSQFRTDYYESDQAIDLRVARRVDSAHAPFAKHFHDVAAAAENT